MSDTEYQGDVPLEKRGMMVPRRYGKELCEISENGAKAFAGTGFNPNNPQHSTGSDALRWAIALQQMRDDRDFKELDFARFLLDAEFIVMQEVDGTRLVEFKWVKEEGIKNKRRKRIKMKVIDGILHDKWSLFAISLAKKRGWTHLQCFYQSASGSKSP